MLYEITSWLLFNRVWKSSVLIIAQMPSVNLDKALEKVKLVRWKAHDDWVEQLVIDKRLNQIISCSNDENHAVIIGTLKETSLIISVL